MLGINTRQTITFISAVFLLQFVSIIRSFEPCPTNCVCSLLENSLSSATCNQFPHLAEFNDDLRVLEIESAEICPISKYLPRFTQLNTLSISNCAVNVDSNSFKNLPYLQSVSFVNASITNFDPSLFEFNYNLKIVNLSYNPLKIWRHFLISASVEVVDLSGCGLNEIPKKTFTQILNLKKLILQGNRLKTFDVILPNSINFLDLSENRLEGVSLRTLKPLENLNEIDISDNPLVCSCKLKLIEKYLSFKNVSVSTPIDCVTRTKAIIPLDQLSLKDVCKLRTSLDENIFVANLLQRLRRSVATRNDGFEEFASITSPTEVIKPQNESVENSAPNAYLLENRMNLNVHGGNQRIPDFMDPDPDRMNMEPDFLPDANAVESDNARTATGQGNPGGGGGGGGSPYERSPDGGSPDRDSREGGSPDRGSPDGGSFGERSSLVQSGPDEGSSNEGGAMFSLKTIIVLLAFVVTLLVLLVIAIVTVVILKMLSQDSGDDCAAAAAACDSACRETGGNEGGCQMPMLSRRCSARKGTCRICPSTMSSRRSRRSCKCMNHACEISDNETVANESQFDCSNMTSAYTTFERPRRC